ncbi:hypothetical protein PHJA_002880300 [Phtheirospermum japonicum]|uniref:Uncharacterized protein n=1 Tax=Phtheirospermum japonicum TaxID=374723 RepID=A0A830DNM0_9LAMI|nr:hypothetical protein PHJA_002880300 [Phtheirospermum japonicum]
MIVKQIVYQKQSDYSPLIDCSNLSGSRQFTAADRLLIGLLAADRFNNHLTGGWRSHTSEITKQEQGTVEVGGVLANVNGLVFS